MDPGPGDTLSGCRLEAKLGQGSTGTVWSARRADGSLVAVKLLAPAHAADPAWCARFAREARAAASIHHPNVVRVHAVALDASPLHVVMELVPGEDLAERLDEEGALPWREAARLARDVARGLAAAHARGVVHGDVKPGNVRVTPDERVKLLDFGLSRPIGQLARPDGTVALLGTPRTMAPEQWTGGPVDARTDLYGLGATLYHLLTGRPPLRGEHMDELRGAALAGAFPPPRALVPEIPEELERLVLRMMALDPAARPAGAADVARELDVLLERGVTPLASLRTGVPSA